MGEWRLKAYSIALPGERVSPKLWLAAQDVVRTFLAGNPTGQKHYGVGFVTVHHGEGENQVNLDRWINQNELMHCVWVSPSDDPSSLTAPPEDHNMCCVWELYLMSFERHAWLAYVLNNPEGADLEAYLSARLDEDV
jgi:hypothetical protein